MQTIKYRRIDIFNGIKILWNIQANFMIMCISLAFHLDTLLIYGKQLDNFKTLINLQDSGRRKNVPFSPQ